MTDRAGPPTTARPRLLGELVVVLLLLRVYDLVRASSSVRAGQALDNAKAVMHLERRLGIGVELPVNAWLTHHHVLTTVTSAYYEFLHITVTMAVLAWYYLRRPDLYRRARTALVAINVLGLAVYAVAPVMPPRLLPGTSYVDTVAAGYGASHTGPLPADAYGAMPSLHVAWAVWVTLVVLAASTHVIARAAALVYPLVTTAVITATANHYLLDAVAGAAVALLSAALAWRLTPVRWPVLASRRESARPAELADVRG